MTGLHDVANVFPTPGSEGDAEPPGLPHVVAGLWAVGLFTIGLAILSLAGDWLFDRYIYGLAGSLHTQKEVGLALQRGALRHDNIVPLYGSSEVELLAVNHARNVFADAPSGFVVFTVGKFGGFVLTTVQNLGALGNRLRGKKLVISVSPTMYQAPRDPDRLASRYAGNLYPLQALTLLLNTDLNTEFRRRFARRLIAHPSMLDVNEVVGHTARLIADESPARRPAYYAFLPVATLHRTLLEVQDTIYEIGVVLTQPDERRRLTPHEPRTPDWRALREGGTVTFQKTAGNNNPFGADDAWWAENREWALAQKDRYTDPGFLREMSESETWTDLEALLQLLQAVGAKPLILCMPFHGPFLDFTGVSPAARAQFYPRVRELATTYGARAVTFEDHEYDPYFLSDMWSHLGPKGWAYYDQQIDAFYHDALH